MSTTELITRSKVFLEWAGLNPSKWTYKVVMTEFGQHVNATQIGTHNIVRVANYSSRTGRVTTPLNQMFA